MEMEGKIRQKEAVSLAYTHGQMEMSEVETGYIQD